MGFMEGYNMTAGNRQMRMEQQRNNLALQQFAAEREDKIQRETDAGKAAEYFFKSNPEALSALGMTDKEFANMSAREQSAAAMGFVQKQTQQQLMQQLAQQKQQMDSSAAFGTAMQRASASSMTLPNLAAPGLMPDSVLPTTHAPSRDEIMASLAATPGAWQSRQARELLNYHLMQDPKSNEAGLLNAKANMMNAQANYGRASGAGGANTEWPDVPNYVKVPDGKGGMKYLPNKPNAQQSLELERQKTRRDSLKTQIQSYDAMLAKDPNAKTSWLGGKRIADVRAELEKQLEDVNSRISDLGNGNDGAAKGKTGGGGDLWQEFMNSQK